MRSFTLVAIILSLVGFPVGAHAEDNRIVIGSSVGGALGLIIFILDLIAIFELLQSSGRGVCSKLVWILIIFCFPIGGLILYWCCARNRTVDQVL